MTARPFLDFDDAGANDDEPAKGVTIGDIRAWHDRYIAAVTEAEIVALIDLVAQAIAREDKNDVTYPDMAIAAIKVLREAGAMK